jgi:hypothetical protein
MLRPSGEREGAGEYQAMIERTVEEPTLIIGRPACRALGGDYLPSSSPAGPKPRKPRPGVWSWDISKLKGPLRRRDTRAFRPPPVTTTSASRRRVDQQATTAETH